jgi:general nucleoside transport system permease protein
MAAKAQAIEAQKAAGPNRKDLVLTTVILVLGVIILLFARYGAQPGETATFTDQELGKLFSLPSQGTLYALAALCMLIGGLRLYRGLGSVKSVMGWSLAFLVAFAFLVWVTSGTSLNLSGMLQDTLKLATPLALGAMAGIFCERSGVFNIAIEGMMLSAAFTAACFASLFDSLWMGVLVGILTGGLAATLHAWLSIKYKVDQIISGTVINILAAGATRFLNVRLADPAGLSTPGKFDPVAIPVLSKIPVIGPIFFNQEPIVYIMLILLPVVQYVLFSTPWGLRLRACGEHPRAADTVGVNVNRMRYIAVILGGMIAGIGGAFFSVGEVGSFEDGMTRGAGFIALAAMIFGKWNPIGAFGAALLFGFADALQVKMQSISPTLPFLGVPIPPEFLQMTPYILTIMVLAGAIGRAVGPAAGGKPYEKQ